MPMLRTSAVWSPRRMPQTPIWQVTELMMSRVVATPTSGKTCNLPTNSAGGQPPGAVARTLK